MKITFNDRNLTRTQKINILAEALVHLTKAPLPTVDAWVNQTIEVLAFPISSIDFKTQLMADMPAMSNEVGKQRKAQRVIAALKETGVITSRGRGSLTDYYLTE